MTEKRHDQAMELFEKFNENWDLRREVSVFGEILRYPTWVVLPFILKSEDLKGTELAKHLKSEVKGEEALRSELSKIVLCIKRSLKSKTVESFTYGKQGIGICYTLSSEGKAFGAILVCGLRKDMSSDMKKLFISFTDVVIRETRQEMELEELNRTIRPRAIALSTVHTVHRLMTATFDINELLPRIAHLTLQVMRANRCSIKMVDRKRKVLLPKVTVDLRQKSTKLKKVQIGRYAPGRAVKKGIPVRGDKYLAAPLVDKDVIGVITIYDKTDGKEFTQFDEEIMKTLTEQVAIAIKNAQLYKEQADITISSIRCISHMLANRSNISHGGEASFLKLITMVGPKLGLNESETKMLQYAAMLHDAGQITVPEKVLMKKGMLTGKEFSMVKKHPMKGASLLSKFKPLKPILPIILYHHENFNGTGYPKGLKGKEIPVAARILAVVSAFEAMIIEKPYRKALSIHDAIRELKWNSGKQFDPSVVQVFCEVVDRKDVKKLIERDLVLAKHVL
ncbi:MAG: HD domain-containing phosphohydrolase [Candidatus Omnitrophota bacterium]